MRAIIFSDLQAAPGNIEECEIVLRELLGHVDKYKPDAVIFLGDGKEVYDSFPWIVAKFWIRATKEISKRVSFYALMGNHDRLSQSIDADNWLDAIQAAGATTITERVCIRIADQPVAFLPYAHHDKLIEGVGYLLAKKPRDEWTVLFFHCGVVGATFGNWKVDGLTPEELGAHYFLACIGGHIHQRQKIGQNIYYAGSPFCMDWGEANQKKGMMLLEVNDGEYRINWLRTKIPGWYTFDYLQEKGIKPEPGAYVRVKVPVSSKKVTDELRVAEQELLSQYGDVNVFAVPEIENKEADNELIAQGATDEVMLGQYVAATLPEAARFKSEQAIEYMKRTLPSVPAAAAQGLRFIGVVADNVLCFESIKVSYVEQGLVVLRGINRDWHRRSNGSGKTSLLSLLTIAFSGENIKGQKTDEWACETNEEPAKLVLRTKSASGKVYDIIRGRRPHRLEFRINGEDRSTGIRGTAKKETQGRIEQILGWDMQSLMNSVYIDQSVANGFLFGTQKDRMDLVAKLQNLERFEEALKLTKLDITRLEKTLQKIERNLDKIRERQSLTASQLQMLDKESGSAFLTKMGALEKEIEELIEDHAELKASEQYYEDLQREVDDSTVRKEDCAAKAEEANAQLKATDRRLTVVQRLIDTGKCPTCGSKSGATQWRELESLHDVRAASIQDHKKYLESTNSLYLILKASNLKLDKYRQRVRDVERDLKSRREDLSSMQEEATKEKQRLARLDESKRLLNKRMTAYAHVIERLDAGYKKSSIRLEMLQYVAKAFHRNGIPLALSVALCPRLNAAAEEFSNVFNDGKVKVRFSVDDGEFVPEVINAAGSATKTGQSVGEAAMAGVVCAFAVNAVFPRTNLLILDEPGHGLDAEGAKEFAKGLLSIKDRYETIIVTTHSPIIESVLSGETIWTVEKKDRASRLIK